MSLPVKTDVESKSEETVHSKDITIKEETVVEGPQKHIKRYIKSIKVRRASGNNVEFIICSQRLPETILDSSLFTHDTAEFVGKALLELAQENRPVPTGGSRAPRECRYRTHRPRNVYRTIFMITTVVLSLLILTYMIAVTLEKRNLLNNDEHQKLI